MRLTFILISVLVFLAIVKKSYSFDFDSEYWESTAQYVPLVTAEFLGCLGVEAQDKFLVRSLKIGTSVVSEFIVVQSLKNVINEERPDKTTHNSFPSGHAATAFCGAEMVRYQYGPLWGAGAYILAAAVGVDRVNHKRHYVWDVGAGALFGVLSARIGIQTIAKIKEKHNRKTDNMDISFSPVIYDGGMLFKLHVNF